MMPVFSLCNNLRIEICTVCLLMYRTHYGIFAQSKNR
jgi:hypothetical protein